MNRTVGQQQLVTLLLATSLCTGSVVASAAEQSVINWLNPNVSTNAESAPLAIIISQPAPSLVFSNNSQSTRVQLAITQSPIPQGVNLPGLNPQGGRRLGTNYLSSAATTLGLSDSLSELLATSTAGTPSNESQPTGSVITTAPDYRASLPVLTNGITAFGSAQATTQSTAESLPTWSVTVEVEQQLAASLAAIGQIHCSGGHFSPFGYTASGCQAAPSGNNLRIGGRYASSAGIGLDLGIFSQSANNSTVGNLSPVEQGLYNATLTGSPFAASDYQTHNSSGLDMGLHLNTKDFSFGAFQVDLAMAEYFGQDQLKESTAYDFKPPWLGTNDLERQAKLHLGWSKGSFSGGLEGIHQIYQEGALANNSNEWSTFNLYFSWQAPWSGRFSIGATNVLDNSLEDNGAQQSDPRQPLDGIFGRVPYVRYKHDL